MKLKHFILTAALAFGAIINTPQEAFSKKTADDSYLFVFFSNNSPYGEQVRYALSKDGFNYQSLNNGEPMIASDTIALKKSIRDPYITRSQDGKTFYMVMTDMRSDEGWQSNDGLILMKSTDLLHWQHTAIHFPTRYPNLAGFDEKNLHAVWAPQVIWDNDKQQYMVYYSIGRHDWEYPVGNRFQPHFKIYYSYANKDFTDLTTPQLLFDFGTAAIDGDIIHDTKNNQYILFFKDEGLRTVNNGFQTKQGVMRAVSQNLTGPYTVEYRHVDCAGKHIVEGSSVYPLINSNEWVLMYDCYADGYYQFCKSNDLKNFTFVQNTPTKGNFTPRHGSVVHLTKAEREHLEAWDNVQQAIRKIQQNNSSSKITAEQQQQQKTDIEQILQKMNKPCSTSQMNKMAKQLTKKYLSQRQ